MHAFCHLRVHKLLLWWQNMGEADAALAQAHTPRVHPGNESLSVSCGPDVNLTGERAGLALEPS